LAHYGPLPPLSEMLLVVDAFISLTQSFYPFPSPFLSRTTKLDLGYRARHSLPSGCLPNPPLPPPCGGRSNSLFRLDFTASHISPPIPSPKSIFSWGLWCIRGTQPHTVFDNDPLHTVWYLPHFQRLKGNSQIFTVLVVPTPL